MAGAQHFNDTVADLLSFLELPLTTTVAGLEHDLAGKRPNEVKAVLGAHRVDARLLHAALLARDRLGRINDVIHAAAISLVLPELLEPDEQLKRPSLAAGNDPTRPFDLETNLRVAEFKLARWRGADAMRKRNVFKDVVHLAAEPSSRIKQLFVLGADPIRFLRGSQASAAWGLDRFPAVQQVFVDSFGTLDTSISEFVEGEGSVVELVVLEERWSALFAPVL